MKAMNHVVGRHVTRRSSAEALRELAAANDSLSPEARREIFSKLFELMAEAIECSDRDQSDAQPASVVKLNLSDKGVLISSDDQVGSGRSLRITRNHGRWVVFILLCLAEERDASALDNYAFHSRDDIDNVHKMNEYIARRVAQTFPELGFHIYCISKGSRIPDQHGNLNASRFSVKWNSDVTVRSPVFKAASLCAKANELHCSSKLRDSFELVIRAVELCPWFFPSYKLCLNLLQESKTSQQSFQFDVDQSQIIVAGLAKIECWLDQVRGGFDMEVIPDDYRIAMTSTCKRLIDERLFIARKLRTTLTDDSEPDLGLLENPANQVLKLMNNWLSGGDDSSLASYLSPLELTSFNEILHVTATHLLAHPTFDRIEYRKKCDNDIRALIEGSLHAALLDLCKKDPHYQFPNPGDRGRDWRESTIEFLAKIGLAQFDTRVTDPVGNAEFSEVIPDEWNTDGTIKRLSHRKPQGRSSDDDMKGR